MVTGAHRSRSDLSLRPAGLPAATGYVALAGACAALFGPVPPATAWLAGIALGALGALARRRGLVACFLLSMLATLLVCRAELAQRWPAAESGSRVVAVARVDSLPVVRDGVVEFDASVAVEAPARLVRQLRVRVTWRVAPNAGPRAGESWRLLLRLSAIRAPRNPGAPDRERLLFRDRVHATGVVVASPLNRRLPGPRSWLPALRADLAGVIREVVADRDAAALFAGLAVGATGAMSREQWRVFGATGTTHLVAISGLHVTMFAWLSAGIARRAWRLVPSLALRVDREPFAWSIGLLAAAGYAVLAGFGVPTQRTLAMLAVWSAFRVAGREQDAVRVLGLALLPVLAIDPLAPLGSGLWLSFGAMAVLLAGEAVGRPEAGPANGAWSNGASGNGASALVRRLLARLGASWSEQWRVTLALAPATLALFSSVPLAGLVANLVAIPVFSFVLVPLLLGSLALLPVHPPLAWAGWRAAEALYVGGWPWLEAMAAWPWAQFRADPSPLALAALLAALPWLMIPAPAPLRAAAVLALLPLAAVPGKPVPHGEAQVTVFDAGDGVAVLVRTRRHALLYDTAAVHGAGARRIESLVLPALRAEGVRALDMLVLASASAHRAEGAGALLASMPVRAARAGGRWPGAPEPVAPCAASPRWDWDGVRFEAHAATPAAGATGTDPGASCVLRVSAGAGGSLLLASQLDAGEAGALARGGVPLASSVVLAPRRGSPGAVSAEFVAAVAPRWVIVGGTAPDAARRAAVAHAWRLAGPRVLSPADAGALRFVLREGGVSRPAVPAGGAWRRIWRAG